jgi:hypothetical protein
MPYTRIFGDLRFRARSKHWNHLDNMISYPYVAEDVRNIRNTAETKRLMDKYIYLNEQCFGGLLPDKTLGNNPIIEVVPDLTSKGKTKDDHSIQLADWNDFDSLAHEMTHSFLLLFKEVEKDNETHTGRTIGDVEANDEMIEDLNIKYSYQVDVSFTEKDYVVSYAGHNSLFYECLYNCFLLWGPDHVNYAYDNLNF